MDSSKRNKLKSVNFAENYGTSELPDYRNGMVNLSELRPLIEEEIKAGFINRNYHPTLPLSILNYSPSCAHEWHWNEATKLCRGLIIDRDWNIVGRSFKKFFTIEQLETVEDEIVPETSDYIVYDKVDGILFELCIYDISKTIRPSVTATRGSFTSEWADMGRQVLDDKYPDLYYKLQPGKTYCFELTTGESRELGLTVVDYGKSADIHLLSIIDNNTGLPDALPSKFDTPIVKVLPKKSMEELLSDDISGSEGYVLYWPKEDFRLKVKFEEYKTLHRLLSLGTFKQVFNILHSGELESLKPLNDAPSSIKKVVLNKVYEMQRVFAKVLEMVYLDMTKLMKSDIDVTCRKDVANFFNSDKCKAPSNLLFAVYDNKDPKPLVWRGIKKSLSNWVNLESIKN